MNLKQRVLIYGLISSFFFSFTFLLNRSMSLSGGSYLWSASLRYLFSFPVLFLYVYKRGSLKRIHKMLRENPKPWILWSLCGFALFYLPLCYASDFASSWFISATWQTTIVAGILMSPLFGHKIPKSNLLASFFILSGVILLEAEHLQTLNWQESIRALIPMLIAAFFYPLGNRKLVHLAPPDLSTLERIYAMTYCSLIAFVPIAIIAWLKTGLPSRDQSIQSLLVSLLSGLLATWLFFHATDLARGNPKLLALAEACIAGEVLFTLLGGILILNDRQPSVLAYVGLTIIILGLLANARAQEND